MARFRTWLYESVRARAGNLFPSHRLTFLVIGFQSRLPSEFRLFLAGPVEAKFGRYVGYLGRKRNPPQSARREHICRVPVHFRAADGMRPTLLLLRYRLRVY